MQLLSVAPSRHYISLRFLRDKGGGDSRDNMLKLFKVPTRLEVGLLKVFKELSPFRGESKMLNYSFDWVLNFGCGCKF